MYVSLSANLAYFKSLAKHSIVIRYNISYYIHNLIIMAIHSIIVYSHDN